VAFFFPKIPAVDVKEEKKIMTSNPRLPDIEKRLQNRLTPDGSGLALSDSESSELLQAFRHGVMVTSTVAPRFEAFPTASYALAHHLAKQETPFWPSLESQLLRKQQLNPAERHQAREALDLAVQKIGLRAPVRLRLATETNGLHSFKIRPQAAPNKVQCLVKWFGPHPNKLPLVFKNDSCPWLAPEEAILDLSELKSEGEDFEIMVDIPELFPGHYEVYALCSESGIVVQDRNNRTALTPIAIGTDDDLSGALEALGPQALEFVSVLDSIPRKSRERSQLLKQALTKYAIESADFTLLGQSFQSCSKGPPGSRSARLFRLLKGIFRRSDLQTKLLDWADQDSARIALLAEHSLPSITLPHDSQSHCKNRAQEWFQSGQRAAAQVLLGDSSCSLEERVLCFGPLLEAWADKDMSDNDRIQIRVNGRDYLLVVENQEDDGTIRGMLTTFDGDEVETVLKPLGVNEFNLVPELSRRMLFTCECGTLVADLRECPGTSKSKTKEGKPVSPYSPVTAQIKKPRSRPQASRLMAGITEARQLALATSRRISSTESDQDVVRMLLDFEGQYTDQAAYGRAMLEWAIPLASAGDQWKKKLWAIDREAKTFKQTASDLQKRSLSLIPRAAVHLLEDYQQLYQQSRVRPAPLALEKAVLDVAITARCVARQPVTELPDDIIDTLARVEDLINEICPSLLRWFCSIVDLILDEGSQ
jgi:hypothetical protein